MDSADAWLHPTLIDLGAAVLAVGLVAVDRMVAPRLAGATARSMPEISEPQDAPVIIAGFGRYGQIVGRLLSANGLAAAVRDHDVEQVEGVRRFGWRAFCGDATRLGLLRVAGAGKAKVFVLAIDEPAHRVREGWQAPAADQERGR